MRKGTLTMLVALALLTAADARAQQDVAHASASITIPTVISIDVQNANVAFDEPGIDEFDAGSIGASSGSSLISTRANVAHSVTIETAVAEMSGPAGSQKPSSHLQWGTGGAAGAFTSLSTASADVVSGLTRGVHNDVAEVWYRMLLDAGTDEPGTYTLAFTYTAIAD